MRGRTFPFNLLDVFVVIAFVVVFFEFELFPRPALRAARHFRAFGCSVLQSHIKQCPKKLKYFLPCSIFFFLRWSLQPFDDVPGQIYFFFSQSEIRVKRIVTYELLRLRRPRRSRPCSTWRASPGCPMGPAGLDHQAYNNRPETSVGFHMAGNDKKWPEARHICKEQDHLRMNDSTGSNNHLWFIDRFRLMII